jgi:hypothetical protein
VEVRVRPEAAFLECVDDLDENFDTGTRHVQLATAVVGENDAVDTRLGSEDGIFPGTDTLEDDRDYN